MFDFWHFCPIKSDLSGNTVWFSKLVKMDYFWHFWVTVIHSKCELSSLRSQWLNETFSLIFKHRVYGFKTALEPKLPSKQKVTKLSRRCLLTLESNWGLVERWAFDEQTQWLVLRGCFLLPHFHSVLKSPKKVAFNIASEASNVYISKLDFSNETIRCRLVELIMMRI